MNQLFKNIAGFFSRIFQRKPYYNHLTHLSNNSTEDYNKTSQSQIKEVLKQRFPNAKAIEVEDTSGGCGAMFKIYVETDDFKDISMLKQHKAIYTALKEQIKVMHGLHVVTKVPGK